ncbi:GNAT family N-acetyltransferase [Paenibacillus sp. FSL R7-0297]|uniref:GNAT family N-acetyltransferase n=1 Tax=unclassified Paenibacillus TaxID=185978 RepID=UPI0018CD9335|nr:GNAT family N-acetyltransferase [Paenibacillus sp. FSL R5-0912]
MKMNELIFEPVIESGLTSFKKRLQHAFSLAIIVMDEDASDKLIPPDQDIERNFYSKGAETYNIYKSGHRIGGVIVSINDVTNHNHLDFFFIEPEHHSKGIGFEVWQAIEEKYPNTLVWQTGTPYFEKRNIHFYVNKCGFQINAFYNEHYPDPHFQHEDPSDDHDGFDDGFFNFIKIMKSNNHK